MRRLLISVKLGELHDNKYLNISYNDSTGLNLVLLVWMLILNVIPKSVFSNIDEHITPLMWRKVCIEFDWRTDIKTDKITYPETTGLLGIW